MFGAAAKVLRDAGGDHGLGGQAATERAERGKKNEKVGRERANERRMS